ncbi:GDP-mannose pyrophosphatase NudK [Brevibacillus migulae]|uniref:GDP-mannose pyrophosphatase NudK n=1 Tax=Brevibacillus migulae TaxID=1644114 RepID=UPI00106E4572|nr:GDP-mannose pyrophosphatase NudK [Brevibacillus migulae]
MNRQNNPKVRIIKEEILSDNWYVLKKVSYEYQRNDGVRETHAREAYDRGNGATILLYNREKQTVVLTKQFRMPTYLNGNETGMLIETCAGLLDDEDPEVRIRRETEEETGYLVDQVVKVGEAYMSPGSVTEILHFYIAEYTPNMLVGEGGGLAEEQEYIEVLELPFAEALGMIQSGEIRDAKTILLLQYAQIHGLLKPAGKPLHIMIAGPHRLGTGDDPQLLLRRTGVDDLDYVLALEAEEENRRFIIPWDREKHERSLHEGDIAHLIIEDQQQNRPVGFCILAGLDNPNQSMELMRMVVAEKGRGVGREALRLIKKWVFTERRANRLWLDVKVDNVRAKSLYASEGFTLEGTLRGCVKNGETFESLHIMSILKSEYGEWSS